MAFQPNARVVVKNKQLHNNLSDLLDARLISVSGATAQVMVDGEMLARTVAVENLAAQDAVYGQSYTGSMNEMPVVNAIRR